MKKGIALFDFDGTITKKDTLLEFIKFAKGAKAFYVGFILNAPFLIAYKLRFISNQRAKEKVISYFFRNMLIEEFESLCEIFSKTYLPQLIRLRAVEEINKLKKEEYKVVIVSASPENWIRRWAQEIHVDLIASQLEIKNGKLSGKLTGKNCYGDEKVNRILDQHKLNEYEFIYAYGDTSGDLPMLKLATNAFYKPFRN